VTSEVTLLRQQLLDSMEESTKVKKIKESLELKVVELSQDKETLKSEVSGLQSQLMNK
jgi:chaperonin cofactor prefoldin